MVFGKYKVNSITLRSTNFSKFIQEIIYRIIYYAIFRIIIIIIIYTFTRKICSSDKFLFRMLSWKPEDS